MSKKSSNFATFFRNRQKIITNFIENTYINLKI